MKLEGKQIGVLVALILGIILALLPVQNRQITVNAQELARTIFDSGDRINPQTVSQWIVEGNEEFMLIDVRSAEEFQQGFINNAVNIPLVELMNFDTIENLDTDKMLILYSNGVSYASQAWVVLHSAGISDVVILEGGLNYWNKVILNPQKPTPYASNDEILVYKAKAAIATSLGGGALEVQDGDAQTVKPKLFIKKKRKNKKADGGC